MAVMSAILTWALSVPCNHQTAAENGVFMQCWDPVSRTKKTQRPSRNVFSLIFIFIM